MTRCTICYKPFGLMRREDSCRKCGQFACKSCLSSKHNGGSKDPWCPRCCNGADKVPADPTIRPTAEDPRLTGIFDKAVFMTNSAAIKHRNPLEPDASSSGTHTFSLVGSSHKIPNQKARDASNVLQTKVQQHPTQSTPPPQRAETHDIQQRLEKLKTKDDGVEAKDTSQSGISARLNELKYGDKAGPKSVSQDELLARFEALAGRPALSAAATVEMSHEDENELDTSFTFDPEAILNESEEEIKNMMADINKSDENKNILSGEEQKKLANEATQCLEEVKQELASQDEGSKQENVSDTNPTTENTNTYPETENKEINEVLSSVLLEVKLEEEHGSSNNTNDLTTKRKENAIPAPIVLPQYEREKRREEELPWCCLCESDAVIRCITCDDDLFCKKCFKYAHEDDDTHDIEKYSKPR
eukprot:m.84725 g.84725  ORF g.84725 m.84725 type:complete len:417 (+) comp12977_c0_seq4:266-1516(+)